MMANSREWTLQVEITSGPCKQPPVHVQRFPFTVGRDEGNDLVLSKDFQVSRVHLTFFDWNDLTLTDQNSTNGTILDGKRIVAGVDYKVPPTCTVTIGQTVLRLQATSSTRPGAGSGAGSNEQTEQKNISGCNSDVRSSSFFDRLNSPSGKQAIRSLDKQVQLEIVGSGNQWTLTRIFCADFEKTPEGIAWLREGYTLLHHAALTGNVTLATFCLEEGENVDIRGGAKDHTAMQIAAREGHLPLVDLLLKWGANVNAMNNLGGSALHAAAFQGRLEVVKVLLKAGADKNLQNGSGRTAAELAAHAGHHDLFELLHSW
jgi:hypothetical protein